MSQRFLILTFITLFVASALFLFWQNERELDPEQGKNWWTLSFALPSNQESLDFTVENHSDNTKFRYSIIADDETFAEATFEVPRGGKITITPSVLIQPDTRTRVIVTAMDQKKEIYR